jgi:cytochrome P450
MSGNWHFKIIELHAEYGHVVRIGPKDLSYDVPEAWEDVYGRSKQRKENPKPKWYLDPKRNEIVGAKEKDHDRMRRLLGSGFTGASMIQQEPMIKANVDLLIQRLRENIGSGKTAVDMFEWFAYCTFDIIGDLTFGDTFGCLRDSMMHPWFAIVFANLKLLHTLVLCNRIPLFFLFLPVIRTYRLWKQSGYFEKVIQDKIGSRLVSDPTRNDFLEIMKTSKGSSVRTVLYFVAKSVTAVAELRLTAFLPNSSS